MIPKTEKSFRLSIIASIKAREWAAIPCPSCLRGPGEPCILAGDASLPRPAWCVPPQPWIGDVLKAPHKARVAMGQQQAAAAAFASWAASPQAQEERRFEAAEESRAEAARVVRQASMDAYERRWMATVKAREERLARDWEERRAERDAQLAREHPMVARVRGEWHDDDPVGVKRQRLVAWLMMAPRRKSLSEARLIASRKYR